jgi:hypothetical protein
MIKWINEKFKTESNQGKKVLKMEMIITGHSHCFCMGVNPSGLLRLEPIQNDGPAVYGVMGAWNGSRDVVYWKFVAKHAKDRCIIVSWAGNQHNSGFIFSDEESFDFVLNHKNHNPLVEGKTIIPKSVLVEHFKPTLGELAKVIEILKKGEPSKIILLETPRPKGDSDFILPFIKSSQYFTDSAKKLGIKVDLLAISTLSFRLKLWQLIQELLANVATDNGVEYVSIPVELQTADGGLKKEFWANDVTHANAVYGTAVIRHLGNIVFRNGGENNAKSL